MTIWDRVREWFSPKYPRSEKSAHSPVPSDLGKWSVAGESFNSQMRSELLEYVKHYVQALKAFELSTAHLGSDVPIDPNSAQLWRTAVLQATVVTQLVRAGQEQLRFCHKTVNAGIRRVDLLPAALRHNPIWYIERSPHDLLRKAFAALSESLHSNDKEALAAYLQSLRINAEYADQILGEFEEPVEGLLNRKLEEMKERRRLSQQADEQPPDDPCVSPPSSPDPRKELQPMIRLFISHSSRDAEIAEALIQLLRNALGLRPEEIRCTSVDGYRLPAGAGTTEQLRQEVFHTEAFIGLISPESISSTFVLFELGARWGANKHLIPVLARDFSPAALKGPLSDLNAVQLSEDAQVYQLVVDLGQALQLGPASPAAYHRDVRALTQLNSSTTH